MTDDTKDIAPGAGEPLPEAWLEVARDYNRPPETPRDELWRSLEAELLAEAGDAASEPGSSSPALRLENARMGRSGRTLPRRGLRWLVPTAAAAALVAVGIGIGRMTVSDGVPSTDAVASAGIRAPDAASPAVRAVALDHLGRSESLLAMVQADARAGRVEGDVGSWAESLLGDTRLLLDSPAADDPAMRDLLEDLELILAQVALLRGDGAMADDRARSELQIIARGMEEQDVMTRIEAVLPSGATSGPAALTQMTGT